VVPQSEYRSDMIEACKRVDEKAMVDWLDSLSAEKEGIHIPVEFEIVPSIHRLVSAEMILCEFNNHIQMKWNHEPVSTQRLNQLIKKHADRIIKVGDRVRYQKKRIIPYVLVCNDA